MIKKMILFCVAILVVIILFDGIRSILNPLTRSEEVIRDKLLQQTPLGSSMEDILQFVKKEALEVRYINYEHGFRYQGVGPTKYVGEKSMRVYFGYYRTINNVYLVTDVTVFYGFNDKEELIDIWVWKTVDGL